MNSTCVVLLRESFLVSANIPVDMKKKGDEGPLVGDGRTKQRKSAGTLSQRNCHGFIDFHRKLGNKHQLRKAQTKQ